MLLRLDNKQQVVHNSDMSEIHTIKRIKERYNLDVVVADLTVMKKNLGEPVHHQTRHIQHYRVTHKGLTLHLVYNSKNKKFITCLPI